MFTGNLAVLYIIPFTLDTPETDLSLPSIQSDGLFVCFGILNIIGITWQILKHVENLTSLLDIILIRVESQFILQVVSGVISQLGVDVNSALSLLHEFSFMEEPTTFLVLDLHARFFAYQKHH